MAPYDIKEELNILDPKKIRLYKNEFNMLKLEIDGHKGNGGAPIVEIVMGFPLTSSNNFISLIEVKDGKRDKEIGMIEDLKKLDSRSRKLLKEELKRVYFMPQITKINRMKETHGIMKFDVETDKGQRSFETRYKEDIRRLGDGRVVIKDSDGNRYNIKDYRKLDDKSVNLIDSEI
jgi:hypothetical protein